MEVINNELQMLNDRQQRCYLTCQDDVRDKYSDINSSGAVQMLNKCANACSEKQLVLLKSIQYNVERKIDEVSKK